MHSIAFVNPPFICDRGDISCSNKEKFDDDDDVYFFQRKETENAKLREAEKKRHQAAEERAAELDEHSDHVDNWVTNGGQSLLVGGSGVTVEDKMELDSMSKLKRRPQNGVSC